MFSLACLCSSFRQCASSRHISIYLLSKLQLFYYTEYNCINILPYHHSKKIRVHQQNYITIRSNGDYLSHKVKIINNLYIKCSNTFIILFAVLYLGIYYNLRKFYKFVWYLVLSIITCNFFKLKVCNCIVNKF